jgi:hypothetical protein
MFIFRLLTSTVLAWVLIYTVFTGCQHFSVYLIIVRRVTAAMAHVTPETNREPESSDGIQKRAVRLDSDAAPSLSGAFVESARFVAFASRLHRSRVSLVAVTESYPAVDTRIPIISSDSLHIAQPQPAAANLGHREPSEKRRVPKSHRAVLGW